MNNQPPQGPLAFDREREQHIDDHARQRVLQQQEELAQREREYGERQERDRQQREQYGPAPHQNNASSIPLHQPVASRLPGAIHSPGGILSTHGGAQTSGPLGAPSGPGNAFGGPLHGDSNRVSQHNPQPPAPQLQQHQGFPPSILGHNPAPSSLSLGVPGGNVAGFGGSLQQQQQEAAYRLQQIPSGPPPPLVQAHQMPGAALGGQGGQQPILNDALSYLDQVKVQFADQPDVYNRFLDIMKDFKSQAIDTPGVINRVSELFAGHPNLIQGFNTFLPPGYRIECGTGNDPNTIRVTTPMGTTVQSITGGGRQPLPESNMSQSSNTAYYSGQRQGNWQPQQPQHSIESPDAVFSPPNQSAVPAYSQNPNHSSYEAQQAAAAAAHQQQQRGVSQLTSAVATLGHPPRNAQTPTPGQTSMNGGGAQPGLEKRGPVEFNHAISYVNKIKNRFQDRPEIYKQFLEILQTYQRESKPIQDVYAQVTLLFNTAPDLLEDFKQFLPESAAQAKAAAAKAAEEAAAMASSAQTPQGSYGGRGESKMPPVGNFAIPASTNKESKKRPRTNASGTSGNQANAVGDRGMGQGGKRPKLHHKGPAASDAPAVSPTLTPVAPEPLPPNSFSSAGAEELAFFERVKKHLANKSITNEFLKLCNLFSQDLIDRNVLVHKVSNFIGNNHDLITWFKEFVHYDGTDEIVDNRPRAPSGKVALSNCRGLGPSYRLLPRRERLRPCSGRDEMCLCLLNDEWASHPTWASEDSGFVAHRKNVYEEGLHRIEEERHDFDFNVEANAKVIQLLEPVAQQILNMSPTERPEFSLPVSLGGSSQAIYRRVIKRIYNERGPEIVNELFKDPCAVMPVVLARLRAKDEEWRMAQREWESVWHLQTGSMYLKSLDHMGIHVKQADKKNFTPKHLVDTIKVKHEEQRRQRLARGKHPKFQFAHTFEDQEVIADLLRLMIVFLLASTQHNNNERRRILDFFEKFVPTFFDIPGDVVADRTSNIDRGTPEDDFDDTTPTELPNGRGRRPVNGKKNDLRRGVLDKGRNGARARDQKEDSATGSKESTPDGESVGEEDTEMADDNTVAEVTNERWAAVPGVTAVQGTNPLNADELDLNADKPFKRESYSLFCNQTIYVFFSVLQALYQRLKDIKDCEEDTIAEGHRLRADRPAVALGLSVEKKEYFDLSPGETYYKRSLSLIEDFLTGDVDENKYQDVLRHYYLKKGWQLYTIVDLMKQLCRVGAFCSSLDTKEKSPDLLQQFYNDRELKETSYNAEINLRKQADKYIKDGELFLIKWFPGMNRVTLQWMQKDEATFDLDDMERKERWQYYTSSFVRIEPTEGIPRSRIQRSVLPRNLPSGDTESEDGITQPKPLVYEEDLTIRICVNSAKILFQQGGSEFFIYGDKPLTWDAEKDASAARVRLQKVEDTRNERFREKFVLNSKWMKGLGHDEVQKVTLDFKKWVDDGVVPGSAPAEAAPVEQPAQ